MDVTEVEAVSLPVNALRESMEEGGGHEEQTEASSGGESTQSCDSHVILIITDLAISLVFHRFGE